MTESGDRTARCTYQQHVAGLRQIVQWLKPFSDGCIDGIIEPEDLIPMMKDSNIDFTVIAERCEWAKRSLGNAKYSDEQDNDVANLLYKAIHWQGVQARHLAAITDEEESECRLRPDMPDKFSGSVPKTRTCKGLREAYDVTWAIHVALSVIIEAYWRWKDEEPSSEEEIADRLHNDQKEEPEICFCEDPR